MPLSVQTLWSQLRLTLSGGIYCAAREYNRCERCYGGVMRSMVRRSLQVLSGTVRLCVLLYTWQSLAQQPQATQVFQALYHTAWAVRDGAPPDINDLVQTQDGYLWLGTKNGLYHFDGVQFERFESDSGQTLLSDDISALLALPNGGLWIGYASGGASRLEQGHVLNYGENAGLGTGSILKFKQAANGVLWAATQDGLKRLQDGTWTQVGAASNFTCARVNSLAFDSEDTLWVSCDTTILLLRKFATQFINSGLSFSDAVGLEPGWDGTMWASGIRGQVIPFRSTHRGPLRRGPPFTLRSDTTLVDHQGRLWVATTANGLWCLSLGKERSWYDRVRPTPTVDSFTKKDGLTSNEATHLLEDREGNLWVATSGGLDRFRRTKLINVSMPSGTSGLTLVAGKLGSVLVSTGAVRPGIAQIDENGTRALPGAPDYLTCSYRDEDGSLWLGGMRSLWHYVHGDYHLIPLPAAVLPRSIVQSIVRSQSGDLWISFIHGKLFRLRNGHWMEVEAALGWPEAGPLVTFNDRVGRTWFGYEGNTLVGLTGDKKTVFSKSDGLDVGDVTAMAEQHGKLWVGGSAGLQLLDGERLYTLPDEGQGFKNISGIVRTESHGLWLSEASGVALIGEQDTARFEQDHRSPMRSQLLGVLDGSPGTPYSRSRFPSAVESTDGVLWFATGSGLTHINPGAVYRNDVVPAVMISSLTADQATFHNLTSLQLPQGTRNIQIDYTALSLSIPERVRFRYRLEGFDKEWINAGTRRQAFYSHIPPGSYRFHVLACNDDGRWNELGASTSFSLPPTFLQSMIFKIVCGIGLLCLLWSFYFMRLRQVTSQIRTRLYDRLTERERIARDLHDTFFQGIQGLLLRFQTGTRQLATDDPTRILFEETLQQSDTVMREGRELVLDLRSGTVDSQDLSEAFANVSRELRSSGTVVFEVTVTGAARAIHPVVYEELYRLGKEALSNAFRHSKGRRIETDLIFGMNYLKLSIRDDGVGLDPTILRNGHRADHWGLPGMRERAKKIGAHFDIWTRQKGGTEVFIKVPADVAYRGAKRPSQLHRLFNATEQGANLDD